MAARFLEKLVPVLDSLTLISGDLFQHLSDNIDQMPSSGSNEYSEPNASEMMAWRILLIVSYPSNGAWLLHKPMPWDTHFMNSKIQKPIIRILSWKEKTRTSLGNLCF